MFKEYIKSREDGTLEQKYVFYTVCPIINEKYFSK